MSGQTVAAEIRAAQQCTAAKFDALQTEISGQRTMIRTLIAILGTAVVGVLGALIAQASQVALRRLRPRARPECP